MYEEKKVKIPFRDIALQILIIVLFILILLWLFPTKKNMKKYVNDNKNDTETTEKQNTTNNNKKENNGKNNTKTETKNNNKKENNDKNNTKTEVKQYEYSKTLEGTYGNYGDWSDWSTNYVASSDTVEVETEVRGGQTGYRTYYVQNGTKTDNNVSVGTKTKKVITGYNISYVRNDITSNVRFDIVDDYIYVLNSGEITYRCADGTTTFVAAITPKYDFHSLSYEDLVRKSKDYSSLNAPSTCANASIDDQKYNYTLYERVPIYETVSEDVYGSKTSAVYEQKTDVTSQSVVYYRYRTRSYKAGAESIKWSSSENDENLIAQGYHFTGNVK